MTQYVPRAFGIVPHAEPEPSVYYTAHNKFKRCYYRAARKAAQQHTSGFDFEVGNVNQQVGKAARQRHCPVGKAAE